MLGASTKQTGGSRSAAGEATGKRASTFAPLAAGRTDKPMASIYAKGGILYAPDWQNPISGAVVKAHSLRTGDRVEADRLWEIEKAQHVLAARGGVAQLVAHRTFNPSVPGSSPGAPTMRGARVPLSVAIAAELKRRAGGIEPATLKGYEGHARHVIAQLGDVWIDTLDAPALQRYADSETERLGRTHTVVKRFESIIKPALRYAVACGQLAAEPPWPRLRSDYRAEGKRRHHLTQQQYASLRLELPEMAIITRGDGHRIVTYPRLWIDLAVCTGMHESDIDRFCGADYDPGRRLWFRRNTKGDAHYEPEWLPVDEFMLETLGAHLARRKLGAGRLLVAELDVGDDGELPAQWMRRKIMWAAHRAGLARVEMRTLAGLSRTGKRRRQAFVVSGRVPSANDLRRTFATWRRGEGWEFADVARWLANSSGMVKEVYAQAAPTAMKRAVARSAPAARSLLRLTRDLEAARRPAQSAARAVHSRKLGSSETRSNIEPTGELTHGKQTVQGGEPTD